MFIQKLKIMLTALINATIYTGKLEIVGKALMIENEKIRDLIEVCDIPHDSKVVDCHNCYITSGLVDLQIYGGGGYLFSNDTSPLALEAMTNALVKSGTTGFLVTLGTNSMDVFRKAIKVVKENPHPAVMGLHFEGPYLNPVKKGAHLIQYIKKPKRKELEELLKEAGGVLKMMTLAPEMCNSDIIKVLKDNGVVISAGHSNANFEEAKQGYEDGITTTTHLFNAISPIHHRETGLPGAAYLSENASASIIADGIHVDFNTLMISKKMMCERLFLITDAVEEVTEGAYIHVKKEDCFRLPDGTLSGSRLTLLKAVRNCVEKAGISLDEALRMASTYPAKVIGANNIGKIEPGYKANLLVFTNNFEPKYTVLEGKLYN